MPCFMVGLTAEALIDYHARTGDPRIPHAIKTAADWLWENIAENRSPWSFADGAVLVLPDERTAEAEAPGSVVLAREIDALSEWHRVDQTGARLVLLRLFREKSDLIVVVPRGGRVEEGAIHPLASAARFLGLPVGQSVSLARVVAARGSR